MEMIDRMIASSIREALADTPVVLVVGARQVGKTTLLRNLLPAARYVTLDDASMRDAARRDPAGFIDGDGTLIIDEIQRVPDLLLAIKSAVDRDRRPGMFVLSGSADVMTLPTVSESLAGRIEIFPLRPLSLAEIAGEPRSFVDVLASGLPVGGPVERSVLLDHALRGGFPDARVRSPHRRDVWFRDYIETVLQREVTTMAALEHLDQLPRLLALVGASSPQPLNISQLASDLALPRSTVDRYLAILRQVFLLAVVPPWYSSAGPRQVKSRRALVCDSGLRAWLGGVDDGVLESWHPDRIGPVFETMVGAELAAQLGWSSTPGRLCWWRTGRGEEVDFVIESTGGSLYGIEVKSASSVQSRDFRGLRALRSLVGDRLERGIVLYSGGDVIPFGDRLEAWPMSSLWGGRALP